MPLYEHVYLARQDLSTQQVEEMTAAFKGIIEGLGGKLVADPNTGASRRSPSASARTARRISRCSRSTHRRPR